MRSRVAGMQGEGKPPAVSAIIVSWNVRALLEQCLRSLQAQVGAGDRGEAGGALAGGIEVIVVDNGSADGSVGMVRERFPWVRVIEGGGNLGFGRANNVGAREARGKMLFLLNPDTVVQPRAIAGLADFLEQHPGAGMAAPRLLNGDGSLQRNAFRFPGLAQTLLDLFPLSPRLMESPLNGRYRGEARASAPFEIDHPLGAAMMVRREAFEQVGGFDEGYFMYAEEVDLCLRIRREGWTIWQVPAARVTHFGGQSTGQVRARMFVELWRARRRFFRRHYPAAFNVAAGLIIRAGVLRKLAASILDEERGRVTREQARELRRAYGTVFRL